jgi:hypothetical protein
VRSPTDLGRLVDRTCLDHHTRTLPDHDLQRMLSGSTHRPPHPSTRPTLGDGRSTCRDVADSCGHGRQQPGAMSQIIADLRDHEKYFLTRKSFEDRSRDFHSDRPERGARMPEVAGSPGGRSSDRNSRPRISNSHRRLPARNQERSAPEAPAIPAAPTDWRTRCLVQPRTLLSTVGSVG